MSFKIEFTTDINGSERVIRTIADMNREMGQLSQTTEKLNQANQEISKLGNDLRGLENFRNVAKNITGLTGALGDLTRQSGGLQGFMSSFGKFGTQIKEMNQALTGQVLDRLRSDIKQLTSEYENAYRNSKTFAREAKESKTKEEADEMMAESRRNAAEASSTGKLLQQAKQAEFMHTPRMGGMSITDMVGTTGRVAGGAVAGYFAAQKVAQWTDAFTTRDVRAERAMFNRDMDIAQSAASGDVGRMMLLKSGVGEESEFMEQRSGFFKQWARGVQGVGKWVASGFTRKDEDIIAEQANTISQLDEPKIRSINAISQTARQRMQLIDPIAQRVGIGRVDEMVRSATRGIGDLEGTGLTQEDSSRGLRLAERFGLDVPTSTGGASPQSRLAIQRAKEKLKEASNKYAADEIEATTRDLNTLRFMSDPRSILGFQRRMGLSDTSNEELFRRSKVVGIGTAESEVARSLGGFGTDLPFEVRQQVSDRYAGITSQFATGISAETVSRFGGNIATAMGTGLGAETTAKVAMGAQQAMQQQVGGGNLLSMELDVAFMELGITDRGAMIQAQRLINSGDQDSAVKFIANLSGKSEDEVRSKLNKTVQNNMQEINKMFDPTGEIESAYRGATGGKRGFMGEFRFGTGSAMGSTAAYDAISSGKAQMLSPEGTQTAVMGATTGTDIEKAGRAEQQQQFIDQANKMVGAIGQSMTETFFRASAQGYKDMADRIINSISGVQLNMNRQAPNSPQSPTSVVGSARKGN